ncbi:MAG: glycosyltransferase [Paludibacteraceae bacterium]|nr:glycosyltransferase [Paludibacteraceae bacterium]
MASKRILLSVTNDLVTDHRVHKTADCLTALGYEVCLIGRRLRNSPELDRRYATKRMRLCFNKHAWFYAEYNLRLFFYLLFARYDGLWANDTDSLPANFLASRLRRKPLVFDAHELFPEVPELTRRPFVKKCWTKIEDWIFPRLKHACTVCGSIADYYRQRYGLQMEVLRNIPEPRDYSRVTPAFNASRPVMIYQGAVNIGRGIEECMEFLLHNDMVELLVVGEGDLYGQLCQQAAESLASERIHFVGRIPIEQLPAYTRSADIGLVLMHNRGLNYYYSLPNRLFDFIWSGTPILAIDFPEIRQIVTRYQIGVLIPDLSEESIQKGVEQLLAHPIPPENFDQARRDLNWADESQAIRRLAGAAYGLPG